MTPELHTDVVLAGPLCPNCWARHWRYRVQATPKRRNPTFGGGTTTDLQLRVVAVCCTGCGLAPPPALAAEQPNPADAMRHRPAPIHGTPGAAVPQSIAVGYPQEADHAR